MNGLIDTAHHEFLRTELINSITKKGITDSAVLNAMKKVPRHLFVDKEFQKEAYIDKALPIGFGQTISQPFTVAYQSQLLKVAPSDKILEIGTGSSYQSCILAEMGAEVFTIERRSALCKKNIDFVYLRKFTNLHFFYGDGTSGLPEFSPFNKIIITAAVNTMPFHLFPQLLPEGVIVFPLSKSDSKQTMVRVSIGSDGKPRIEEFGKFVFVPLLPGKE